MYVVYVMYASVRQESEEEEGGEGGGGEVLEVPKKNKNPTLRMLGKKDFQSYFCGGIPCQRKYICF